MDRVLVEQAQRGDRTAYEELVRASASRLLATAHRILRDADRAEDATQQALIAIWRELPSLRDPDRFDAWTYRLVARACINEHRRHHRGGVRQIPVDDQLIVPDDAFGDIAVRDQLRRGLDQLSVDHRTVLVLHFYADLPLADIAEILGVPFGTVGSRLHHATRALRAALDADERAPAMGRQPA